MGAAGTGLSGPASRPAPPEFKNAPPEFDESTIPDTEKVKEVLGKRQFDDFLGLLGISKPSTAPTVGDSSAVNTANSVKAIQNIFNFLGKPELATKFKDKIVLVGVSMVSVTPGTETASGYMADVSVSVSYTYQPIRYELLDAFKNHGNKAEQDWISQLESTYLTA
ncbi:MAG: hypothetical protein IPK83_08105 [Planctomycetes bacterium]|nr:hypothetical protein [Planctomycetota bacterium]